MVDQHKRIHRAEAIQVNRQIATLDGSYDYGNAHIGIAIASASGVASAAAPGCRGGRRLARAAPEEKPAG